MAISPYKTFSAGEILTASDLNSSFSHITTNAEDLAWPATKAKNFNAQSLTLDGDGDTSITADTDDQIDFQLGGVDAFTMYTVASAVNGLSFTSSATGDPVLISAYGTDTNIGISLVPKGTGVVTLGASVASGIVDLDGKELILDADGDTSITADTDDRIDFKLGGSDKIRIQTNMEFLSGMGIDLNGHSLILDVDGDTSITADSVDRIDFNTGGTDRMRLGGNLEFVNSSALDLNGNQLILDFDADTYISSATDDQVSFFMSGTEIHRFSMSAATDVNGVNLIGAVAGSPARITAIGTDLNINLNLKGKGTSAVVSEDTFLPVSSNSKDIGDSSTKWKNFYLAGTAFIDGDVDLNATGKLILDSSGNTYISSITADDQINFLTGGVELFRIDNLAAAATVHILNSKLDLNANEIVLDADGDTSITADTDDRIDFKTGGVDRIRLGGNLEFVSTAGVDLNANELILDANADTSITADTDDQIDIKVGGVDQFQFLDAVGIPVNGINFQGSAAGGNPTIGTFGTDINIPLRLTTKGSGVLFMDGTVDIDANELILDADADTSITADTDDVIDFKVGGSDRIRMFSDELGPVTDSVTDLGDTSRRWANCYIDDLTITNGIDQGNLKSTTGTVTTVGTSPENFTLPGGEYGFYPQLKESGDGIQAQLAGIGAVINIGNIFVTNITLDVNTGVGAAQQRYIQASPPYDLGDGDVPLFVFARVDNTTKEVLSAYVAPEAPWHYNGPTSIVPDFKKDGKKYQRKLMLTPEVEALRKRADFLTDPVVRDEYLAARKAAPVVDVEITQAIYQADMDIIPHPFRTTVPGTTIVLLDPVAVILNEWLALHEAGEDIFEILRSHAQIGNTALTRFGPAGVMIPSIKWKITR